jgi:hypothetical protein
MTGEASWCGSLSCTPIESVYVPKNVYGESDLGEQDLQFYAALQQYILYIHWNVIPNKTEMN